MLRNASLFSQLLGLINRNEFARLVKGEWGHTVRACCRKGSRRKACDVREERERPRRWARIVSRTRAGFHLGTDRSG